MYEIVKNVIETGSYELVDMLYKINKMYIEGSITETEKTELDSLARQNAKAENSYASAQEQIDRIYEKLDNLEARLNKLEGVEEPTEATEEYPEFKQPTGAHDAYNTGMGCTFNGEKYICLINGCVWDPITYPAGWKKVE